jgi:virginiamycin B lyase
MNTEQHRAAAAKAASKAAKLVTLAALILAALAMLPAAANAYIYWANGVGHIGRANLDGSGVNQHFFPSTEFSSVTAFDLAVDTNHLYWGTRGDGAIERVNRDGSGGIDVFGGAGDNAGVAVDADHVYWTDLCLPCQANEAKIGRANLDFSSPNANFITGLSSSGHGPRGIAVDASHIYWANSALLTISRADLDGTNVDQSFITGISPYPYDIVVNASHIYWTNGTTGTISRADLDGTNVDQSFITGANNPTGIAVDASHIYWGNWVYNSTSTIGRANLDGTNVDQSFITGADRPDGVAVDQDGAPPETTIDAGPSGPTTDTTPTFEFSSSELGSTFECSLDTGSPSFGPCSGPGSSHTPASALADGNYVFRVRATDGAGNTDSTPATRSFSVVSSAPSIITTSPSDGLSGFSRTAPITVLFDQAMNKPSAEAAFSLKRTSNGKRVTGSFSWSGNALIFSPNRPLAAARVYTATVGTGARNLTGTHLATPKVWKFSTTPQPLIRFVFPVNGASGIPRFAPVFVLFDTAMNKTSAQAAFSLRRTSNAASVSGNFGWFGNVLIFKPVSNLTAGVSYTARETNGAKNLDGRPVESGRTWVFSVGH